MIVVFGASHHTAPVPVREALRFPEEGLLEALGRLRERCGLQEAMILSTCNRVEVYGQGDEELSEGPLLEALAHGRALTEVEPYLYRLRGEVAVRHAFRVAASLDSLVLGEPQILGQVKTAYAAAERAGCLGSVLQALRSRSVAAAKRARSETGIGQNAVSVSSVAVELARKIFGDLEGRSVLLVGAGKMSELAARQLVRSGALLTVVAGRSFLRAEGLAAALQARAVPFEALQEELGRTDIVISSTAAPGAVIRKQELGAARKGSARPLFLIDIAVPRDVEAACGELPGVFVYDMDDLAGVAEANLKQRRKAAAEAEAIVEREVREFLLWQRQLEVVPLLSELRARAEEVRKAELERLRKRLPPLSAAQDQALEAATSAIVSKLLHAPTVQLKELARNGHTEETLALVRRLMGL